MKIILIFFLSLFLSNIFAATFQPDETGKLSLRFMHAKKNCSLFEGPGKNYGVLETQLRENEVVYYEGVSLKGAWAKVITSHSVVGWVPVENLEDHHGAVENQDDFNEVFESRNAIGSRLILSPGVSWGSHPLDFRLHMDASFNFFPDGVVDLFYDQLELGLGGNYHFYAPSFSELHSYLQWIYRFGSRRDTMLGPRIGYAIMEDPSSQHQYSSFLLSGLSFRHYWNDYWGLFCEAQVYLRTVIYVDGNVGITLRF
jgi:hypothetical protein